FRAWVVWGQDPRGLELAYHGFESRTAEDRRAWDDAHVIYIESQTSSRCCDVES
ncbi:hypothetical protein TNCV_2696641, partial [Trichonephila clavipes]